VKEMAIADEKIAELHEKNKEGIALYPGMAGMTRDIVEKLKKEGVELLSVDFMVTQKCNFRCSYCYAGSSPEESLAELTMKECKDLTQQCINLGVRIININGGEPLYWHPSDWKESGGKRGMALFHLIEYIRNEYKKANLPLDLVSFTNVSLITPEKAKLLYHHGMGLCCKLDSLDPRIQDDLLETKGGFKQMMEGYKNLQNAGYGQEDAPPLTTNTVVTPVTYNGVPEVFRWSRSQGFKPFVIPVHVHGRLQEVGGQDSGLDRTINQEKKNLSPLDIKVLFETLSKIDGEEFGIEWEPLTPWVENKACSRHLGGIHIRADGIVVPCSEAPDYWALGDIRKESLADIISNPLVKKFRNMYSELHGKCSPKNCTMAAQGMCYGCRTRSYDDSAYDDEGNYDVSNLDPEAFFGGDPACWRGMEEKQTEKEAQSIVA
jgi:radical SAM protein with 4Fe4S-binding SPASM domain